MILVGMPTSHGLHLPVMIYFIVFDLNIYPPSKILEHDPELVLSFSDTVLSFQSCNNR